MSKHTAICDLKDHVGETVTLAGWLYNSRRSGKIAFLILRDGTGLCQCVLEKTDASVPLAEAELRFPCALLLGNEVAGLTDEVLRAADLVCHLPMHGLKSSLNVAVAAGVALYEIRRAADAER